MQQIIVRHASAVHINNYPYPIAPQALQKWRRAHPEMRTLGQLSAETSWRVMTGPMYDHVPLVTAAGPQTYLKGKGKFLPRYAPALQALAAVLKYVEVYGPEGWTAADVHAIFERTRSIKKTDRETGVLVFKRGEVHEDDIGSLSYTRTRKRINFFVQFNYPDGPFVAKVLHWLRIPHPGGELARVLRLPIVTFYKTTSVAPYDYEAAAEEAREAAAEATAAAAAGRGGRAPTERKKAAETIAKAATEAARLAAALLPPPAVAPAVAAAAAAPAAGRRRARRARGGAAAVTAAAAAAAAEPARGLLLIDTTIPVDGEEYYAADPDTIVNKLVVFYPGGSEREGPMYAASYSHLTAR